MKPAILYVRRSTTKQEDSFAIQRNALETFAETHGYTVIKEFRDTKSGRTIDREAFQACLEYLKSDPEVILIVYRIDRMGRSWQTLGLLENLHQRVRSIGHGDAPIDETLFAMLNVMAKAESQGISARVKASYALRRAQNPDVRFGRDNEHMDMMRERSANSISSKAIEFEKKVLFWDYSLQQQGFTTLADKVRKLNELGFTTRRGCKWSAPALCRTINRALERVPPITAEA
jgi:hypothetical protein